jgi:hypothetical protein
VARFFPCNSMKPTTVKEMKVSTPTPPKAVFDSGV